MQGISVLFVCLLCEYLQCIFVCVIITACYCICFVCEYLQCVTESFCIRLHCFWSCLLCEYLQCMSVFVCVVTFAAHFCICLLCNCLFRLCRDFCSHVLYLFALWLFSEQLFIWLCHDFLQHVSVFGRFVSIYSMFRASLFVCVIFAAYFCVCLFSLSRRCGGILSHSSLQYCFNSATLEGFKAWMDCLSSCHSISIGFKSGLWLEPFRGVLAGVLGSCPAA